MKLSVVFRVIVLFFVIFSLLITPQTGGALHSSNSAVAQAENTLNFCITEVPVTGAYPNVKINFRVFDQLLTPVAQISDQDIRISENGMPAVPFTSGMQSNAQGLGMDFYILIDRGNRTDQYQAKYFLDSFITNIYNDALDTVQIYTDEGNQPTPFFPSPTASKLAQAIANFPTEKVGSPRIADSTIQFIMNNIEGSFNTCQKPKILFMVLGDDVISSNLATEISQRAKKSFTKLILFHTPNPRDGAFASRSYYEQMAVDAGGQYIQVVTSSDTSRSIANAISGYRQSYTGTYRTNNGVSGSHDISFVYKGVNTLTKGSTSYTISLLKPQATLVVPTIIERTAKQSISTGYVYDKPTETVSVNVAFPDGFPRKVESKGMLIINRSGSSELRRQITLTSSSGDVYQFSWDLADIGDASRNDLTLKVELSDETGLSFTSQDVPVTILSHVPLSLMGERYLVYIMLGLVLLLVIALIVMWRRMGNLVVRGRDAISNVAGVIRKTIVGGGARRGKALATLKVIDGPPSMINQELKIFSESVKLGRDPQKADMTFHAPEANSSVSGLHARIEKVNGAWRIVAVSQSGSETFVDDSVIPFNEPYPLHSGQVVRLGYLAQQPVVFTFNSEIANQASDVAPRPTIVGGGDDIRKTIVEKDKTIPANVIKISADKKEVLKQSKAESDNIFDEFRDR